MKRYLFLLIPLAALAQIIPWGDPTPTPVPAPTATPAPTPAIAPVGTLVNFGSRALLTTHVATNANEVVNLARLLDVTAADPSVNFSTGMTALTNYVDTVVAALETGVTSVNGEVGVVVLDKTDVGLANVDNTTDLNKPISTATQTALDGKASTASVALKADDNTVVKLTGAQAVAGTKTWADTQVFSGGATLNLATVVTSGDLPVASGGTGASDAATARSNLGADNASNLTAGLLPIARIEDGTVTAVKLDPAVQASLTSADLAAARGDHRYTFITLSDLASTATVTSATFHLIDATSNNVTVALPAAGTANTGQTIVFKRIDATANVVILDPAGAETIDGQPTLSIPDQWMSIPLVTDGSTWYIAH